jgi:plastocyanin
MRRLVIAIVAALVVSTVAVGTALAQGGPTTVKTLGEEVLKPNEFIKVTFRFAPASVKVRSGDKIRFLDRDKDADEPHTATIVDKVDLPRKAQDLEACYAPGGPCAQALGEHDPNQDQQPPFNPVVDKGAPGLNRPGDSLLFGGELDNQSVSARVTAPRGTTLYYLCAIDPWMQGRIKVR